MISRWGKRIGFSSVNERDPGIPGYWNKKTIKNLWYGIIPCYFAIINDFKEKHSLYIPKPLVKTKHLSDNGIKTIFYNNKKMKLIFQKT